MVGISFFSRYSLLPVWNLSPVLYRLAGLLVIPMLAYSSATDSAITCLVSSFTSVLLVLPFAMVTSAWVTSSTLFSTFRAVLSLPVMASFTTSGSMSNRLMTVFEFGLRTTFMPPRLSATMVYSPLCV